MGGYLIGAWLPLPTLRAAATVTAHLSMSSTHHQCQLKPWHTHPPQFFANAGAILMYAVSALKGS